ncbi:L,D-transpeptidase-like protein [Marinilabilia salmonicolor]|jgi:hypothetical protein|uniref:murein L,D-transpeptidase catalytic domain family protein n=1 Tax=Marinilabilia salmonicolor TaxID=989 RepID=UPI000D0762B5|nr:murein L,D-transpeptidase catalytic domain family protein [Marinilabilia salmonicolor]PRY99950.1 L,D-transpeptidase-like protein [Marinilabilia salmonicolor]
MQGTIDKRLIFVVVIFFLNLGQISLGKESEKHNNPSNNILTAYNSLTPGKQRPSFEAFRLGMKGKQNLMEEGKLKNKRYLTLIDFSLSSTQKRLWVIDCDSLKIVQHTLVAHGKNTGENKAERFSNVPQSNMSSLGFFIAGETYYGKHGFSLRLDGVEPGINDKARERAIVIHAAEYATMQFVNKHGRLGRSFGCPALPPEKNKTIIQSIKNKSCVFIYYPEESYFSLSEYASQSNLNNS